MQEELLEIQRITNLSGSGSPPTFENTIEAMELAGSTLKRVSSIFFNLCSANTSETLQKIQEEISPKLAAHEDKILCDRALFQQIENLWNLRDQLELTEEQLRLLERQYLNFIRAGANLPDEDQTQLKAINEELSKLTIQFKNNLLAITKERTVVIDDVKDLDGMSDSDIAAAAEAARNKGNAGKFLVAIVNTTRQPSLASVKNRAVRETIWKASANRGIGENGGIDNRPLVLKIAKLRAKKAALLGFSNYAEYAIADQMAKTPERVKQLLTDLIPKVLDKVRSEFNEIKVLMQSDGIDEAPQPWDWEFYATKLTSSKYAIDEQELKPYFELNNFLINGLFYAFGKLYSIEFKERTDLPLYVREDSGTVRTFDVLNNKGSLVGILYTDYLQRDNKSGGAWNACFVCPSKLLNQKAVVVNVMNIPMAAPGEAIFLDLDQVKTMFHELGHAVHGLFSDTTYPSLAGTLVPRDWVEFPSTVHEDWAVDQKLLNNYARHYQTGELIPNELIKKVLLLDKANKGYDTFEYLAAALLDLGWHSLKEEQISDDPDQVELIEKQLLSEAGLDFGNIHPRYRTSFFAHIWSGGYSAAYYAYLWSEILAADAFEYMKQQGGIDSDIGLRFKDEVLAHGAAREESQQFRNFLGRDAQIDPFLRRRGLVENI